LSGFSWIVTAAERPKLSAMIAVVERDRRLAQRLVTALEARGCEVRVAHGYRRARTIFRSEQPAALYVSEMLHRASGGDLLADFERHETLCRLPALVRVSHSDSVFPRAMRRGGLQAVEAPLDVEAVAERLARMERGGRLPRIRAPKS